MINGLEERKLQKKSKSVRLKILNIIYEAQSGHFGGSLSCVEILIALYFIILNKSDRCMERDRFILSKGHAAPALYSVFAELGVINDDELISFRKLGSRLQGHPDMKRLRPYVEISSGSLGQGLSVAVGMALAAKINNYSYKVYVLMGDSEIEEGQVWEAANLASEMHLQNLIAIIDCNSKDTELNKVVAKWSAFGWSCKIIDGHDYNDIINSINNLNQNKDNKPNMIIAKTIKGKGIDFMENNRYFHNGKIDEEMYQNAINILK